MTFDLISPADWPRVAALFDEAAELDDQALPAWCEALRAREPALADAVLRLLAARAPGGTADWLARGPRLDDTLLAQADALPARSAGDRLGRFQLLRHVARGGMGEVWQAQAVDALDAGPVALKLPLLHRAGGAAAARFEREARFLSTLQHPHIARLLEAGSADDGTPYLALEWVDGLPLHEWCAQRQLARPARLQLFRQVLDAVAYAHSRLVLHRDLKPANILVDAQGQVKLLDFGIAKLMSDGAQADATELTRAAGRVMTPSYAAPEQVRGQTLTPATDVYALGVVLFELLTGQRPHRTRFASVAQLEQAIDSGDLLRPGELDRSLRGDIDAIVGKALQRDPAQRYVGASAFADDLLRHLDGRAVLARGDTLSYVAGRFVRRHRGAALAAMVSLLALLLGVAATLLQAARAERERDRALAATRRAETTQQFMLDLLGEAARDQQAITVPQLLERAERIGRRGLADRPDELATVLALVGSDETTRRDPARSRALLDEAATLARDPVLKVQLECRAGAEAGRGRQPDADAARLRALIDRPGLDEATRTACRLPLAQLLIMGDRLDEADRLVEQAWASVADRPEAWRERLWALTMQTYLRVNGRAAGLDARIATTLQQLRDRGQARNDEVLGLYNTWGTLALVSGEPARAVERFAVPVATYDSAGGPPPYHLDMLASAHNAWGQPAQAAALLDRSLALAAPASQEQYRALCLRGRAAALLDRHDEALALFARAAAVPDGGEPLRRNAEPFCRMSQAESRVLAGQPAEAAALLAPVLAGPHAESVKLSARLVQAEAALALGQVAEAERLAQEAERDARALQADNRWSSRTGQALALRALATGDAALRAQALDHLRATVVAGERWRRRLEGPFSPARDSPRAAAASASRTRAGP